MQVRLHRSRPSLPEEIDLDRRPATVERTGGKVFSLFMVGFALVLARIAALEARERYARAEAPSQPAARIPANARPEEW
jgi:hypothetical protein